MIADRSIVQMLQDRAELELRHLLETEAAEYGESYVGYLTKGWPVHSPEDHGLSEDEAFDVRRVVDALLALPPIGLEPMTDESKTVDEPTAETRSQSGSD